MNVALIDADLMDNGTRHPNLALMKLAGFHRDRGDSVELIFDTYDRVKFFNLVYISKVFNFTRIPKWVLEEKNVRIGGTGFFEDGGPELDPEIEHHMPFYDLYKDFVEYQIKAGKKNFNYSDYLDYSIGFTTRGCFRKCSFCVNKKYDKVCRHAPVKEFFDDARKSIYLWDDNILAFPEWEEIIDELAETGKTFQFRQGIDLRLMTDKKAFRLNNVRYHGDFIFAFDHIEDKDIIISGIQLWKKYTNKYPKMYLLTGYLSQDEIDIENVFERIKILMTYGSLPYIMRYEEYRKSRFKSLYIQIARWCNQPQFFKKKSFREFCEANQYYHSLHDNKRRENCSTYQAMIDFEFEFPDISKRYFDLKLENESIYNVNYGYGRKYFNKQDCAVCKRKEVDWTFLVNNDKKTQIIDLYLNKELDMNCLIYKNSLCKNELELFSKYIVNVLLETEVDMINTIIKNSKYSEIRDLTDIDIPQIKIHEVVELLESIVDRKETILSTIKNKEFSIRIKDICIFLSSLDLLKLYKINQVYHISITEVGKTFLSLSNEIRVRLFKRLLYRNSVFRERL